jgi:uncharacterized membrane protein YwaF
MGGANLEAFYEYLIKPRNVMPDCRLFSAEHLILSALSVLFIIFLFNLQMKHCNENYSKTIMKRAAIIMLILEIFRIFWRTYYYGFSLKNLSFGWCNQICLILPFIVLSGSIGLFPYIDILSFMGGIGVIIYPIWVFYDYAGLHILSLQSMISHTLMVIIPMTMLFISDHQERYKSIKKPLIGFGIIAAIAAIMARALNTNYLIMLKADGIPLLDRFSFPWYWLIASPCLILIIKIVGLLFQKIDKKISDRKADIIMPEHDDVVITIAQPENTP